MSDIQQPTESRNAAKPNWCSVKRFLIRHKNDIPIAERMCVIGSLSLSDKAQIRTLIFLPLLESDKIVCLENGANIPHKKRTPDSVARGSENFSVNLTNCHCAIAQIVLSPKRYAIE